MIYPKAHIVTEHHVHDEAIIDDFVFISAPHVIDRWCHIAAHASVMGRALLDMRSGSGLSAGVRVFTSTDNYTDGSLMNPAVPERLRTIDSREVVIENFAIVGANSVVMPGVRIGFGAVVGANSFVPAGAVLEDGGVYAGCPVRKVGHRDMAKLKANIAELVARHPE